MHWNKGRVGGGGAGCAQGHRLGTPRRPGGFTALLLLCFPALCGFWWGAGVLREQPNPLLHSRLLSPLSFFSLEPCFLPSGGPWILSLHPPLMHADWPLSPQPEQKPQSQEEGISSHFSWAGTEGFLSFISVLRGCVQAIMRQDLRISCC